MKAALLVFVAAAAFFAATIMGVLRLGSSQAELSVIVLRGHDGVVAGAGVAQARRVGRTAVRQRVERTKLSAFQAGRAHRDRP